MDQFKRKLLFVLMAFVLFISVPANIFAQQGAIPSGVAESPQVQQAIQPGQVTPQQIKEGLKALEKGRVSPETVRQYQEKSQMGGLTPAEIEAGKKFLEQKAVESPEQAEPEDAKAPEKKEAAVEPEEEFFKKTGAPAAPPLEIFGHKLFSAAPGTFAPVKSLPVSNDYLIGPGDEIKVLMWGRIDATYSLEVDNEGVINFPKIGPLTVAGLTYGEIKELIKRKVEAITGVNVNISMGRLRTVQVFVLGEVKTPGVFTVSSLATVSNALLASGGPTKLGALRNVQLKRKGRIVTTVDLYDFLLKGDTSKDARLMPGDVVFIPQAGPMVTVSGNVRRPAIYELKDKMTLRNTLDLAGGLTPKAFNQRIQIERAFKNRFQVVLDVSYEDLRQKEAVALQDGDLIRVFSILPSTVNAVYLYGNVLRPGRYAFKPGSRILDILPDMKGLEIETYLDYALIKRYHVEDMKTEIIPFDLGRLLLSKDDSQNIRLKPLDEIYIFNKSRFEDKAYADIDGQIRQPGRYFIDNKAMRLKDLIFKAGLLTRNAYMEFGHLYRTDRNTKEVTIQSFNLKKTLKGDPQHNLLLQDLDQVVIHSTWEYRAKYTVSIKGLVNKPGEYPYAVNMTVKDLILVAGNVKYAAYLDQAELVRFNIVEGRKVETSIINFDIRLALENKPDHNMKLQPLDIVNIKEIPEWWDKKKTITISGEVFFPGTYQIRKGERISSIIERAGGYAEYAYLRGAVFTRESVRMIQQERINEMVKKLEVELASESSAEMQTALSKEDLAAQVQYVSTQKLVLAKLKQARSSGRVVVTLLEPSVLKTSQMDMVLEDGDTLNIPKKPSTVNVLGSVYNPTALIYDEGRPEVKYYLAMTGGPTESAEEDEMYVIQANGTVLSQKDGSWWRDFGYLKLYPGDTVLVPLKITRPSYLRDVKDITQVLFQMAVTAGVLIEQVF